MSTASGTAEGIKDGDWKAGVVGGITGALAMGVLVLAMKKAVVAMAIPALYGLAPPANVAAGLFFHLSHGAVLGVVFAAIIGAVDADSYGKVVGIGAAWGLATWILLAGLVMPLWLQAVGFSGAPPFPNFAPPSALWHLTYGVVLGAVYLKLEGRF